MMFYNLYLFVIRRLAVIDSTGVLTLIEISEDNVIKGPTSPEANSFQRRDVWTMKWASDDPELLAIMEKTRMYVIRGFNPEEPISTSAYIASFEVKMLFLIIVYNKWETVLVFEKHCLYFFYFSYFP